MLHYLVAVYRCVVLLMISTFWVQHIIRELDDEALKTKPSPALMEARGRKQKSHRLVALA